MPTTVRILVVEDDLELAETLTEALEARGHRVAVAHQGQEALDALDGLARPALVFLDLFMPVLDGLGFLNALRGRADRADFEVVVMSAVVNVEWFTQVPGILRALKKAMDLQEMLEIADSFVAGTTAPGAASEASSASEPGGFVAGETAPASGAKSD